MTDQTTREPLYVYLQRDEGVDYCLNQIKVAWGRGLSKRADHRPNVMVFTYSDYQWLTYTAVDEPPSQSALDVVQAMCDVEITHKDPRHAKVKACTYEVNAQARGLGGDSNKYGEFEAFNRAWGFEDGACNELVSVGLVAKQGTPRDFLEAHMHAIRGASVRLRITVMQDGTKKAEVIDDD